MTRPLLEGAAVLRGLHAAIRYKLRRLLGTPALSLEDAAQREWVVAPGAVEPAPRLLLSESQLDRIQDSVIGESREEILQDLGARELVHRPTRAFLLKDVLQFDRALYCGMHKGALFRGEGVWRALLASPSGELDQALWTTSYAGSRWYGHFLRDEVALELLARPMGDLIGHERPIYPHEPGWRKVLSSPRPRTYGSLWVGELTVFDDLGQHPEKRRRYQALRSRLSGRPRGHDRVLFLRGRNTGEDRQMVNQEAVVSRLSRDGFHVIDSGRQSVEEILTQCFGARLVVTVEGSHASPLLYLASEGAPVIYICPPARVASHSPRLACFCGLRGGLFVAEPVAGPPGHFRVDPEELLRMVDQADPVPRTTSAKTPAQIN